MAVKQMTSGTSKGYRIDYIGISRVIKFELATKHYL